ncbi:MAG: 2-C-methyl-D-erythritol 4-phosphate cytidylyltransferase [Clostridium sp.]|nr:2-C-methyl-D-erythritol 4-phosphate cytidylyltransferase [Clostridium sp.]
MDRPLHIALVLAGGQGNRMHNSCPKQFMVIEGEPVIVHTLRALCRHEGIDAVYVVCAEEWRTSVGQWAADYGLTKFKQTFPSGSTSFQSLINGVDGLASGGIASDSLIMVHEAVRPLISQQVITDNLDVCTRHGNAIAAVKSEEAYMVSADGCVSAGFQPREQFYRAQTPQTFPLKHLQEAFREAEIRSIDNPQSLYTLMAELKLYTLYISRGDSRNFKITVPEDIETYRALIRHTGR